VAGGVLVLCFSSGAARGNEGDELTLAARLVEAAGEAEADGNTAGHFAMLREAVSIAPDYQPARSKLGQIKVDGEWLAIEEAQRRAAADPKQAIYRKLRREHGDGPDAQLELARWCHRNDLDDESRFHWASVLSIDPNHKEALRVLKMRWHDGQLRTPEQIRAGKSEAIVTRRASRQWSAEVAGWERELSKKLDVMPRDVYADIGEVNDPAAIPAFEAVTLDEAEVRGGRHDGRLRLSLAFLDALAAMSDHAATQSLVRHAVLSRFDDVRYGASDRLQERPLHDVVPLLLDGLSAQIESSFRVVADNDGSVHFLHSIYRQGPFADWSYRASRSIHQQPVMPQLSTGIVDEDNLLNVQPATTNARVGMVSAGEANRSAERYQQQAFETEQQIVQANERAAAMNERIVAVLTRVTNQDLGNEPRPWWDWWQGYNEYDQSAERPVYQTEEVSDEYVVPEMPLGKECFAPGTPVWTKLGQRPIELLQLGDLVLAQDVNTGELSYKPVIGRTERPPSEIIDLSIGDETLRTTRGHPFWVSGIGWRMAKELEDGAFLYGMTGTTRVESAVSAGQETAYNLVVADFHSYFVGERGVLVHDNSPRRPTRATVPGLVAK
jgi:hypothetical protein